MKAVIFDWGGVIGVETAPLVVKHVAKAFGIREREVLEGWKGLVPQLQTGKIPEEEFWRQFAKNVGKPLPENGGTLLREPYEKNFELQEGTLEIAKRLSEKGIIIGVLSNTVDAHQQLPEKQEIYRTVFGNRVVLSCKEKVRKPNPEAWKAILDKLGANAHETVHVDNELEFAVAAKEEGLNAVLFENPKQLERELKKMGLPL